VKLSRYGIVLETMTANHLEMVRLWRNQDYIRQKMQFQKRLARSDQQKWFELLNPETNLYWIIYVNNYPIGLVHIKDIDEDRVRGEAGIFIGEPSFLEMPQAMLAILFMMELAFFNFGIKQLCAKIHCQNRKAIRFNLDLGYVLQPNQPENFQYYFVDKIRFETTTEALRTSAAKLYDNRLGVQNLRPGIFWDERLKIFEKVR